MKEAGKQILYLVVAAIIAVIVLVYCSPDTYELGDRFTVRRGGEIEIEYLEGDSRESIFLHAVGSSYFRLIPADNQWPEQMSAEPEYVPLGFYQDDYFAIAEFVHAGGTWKVDDGKGPIEVEFSDVQEIREIQIEYEKPLRFQIWVSIGAFIGFLCFIAFSEEFL